MKESGTNEAAAAEDKMALDMSHSLEQVGMGNTAKQTVQWEYRVIGEVVAG